MGWPSIHVKEFHQNFDNVGYLQYPDICGDPEYIASQPPTPVTPTHYLSRLYGAVDTGLHRAYGHQWRESPNYTHPRFEEQKGFPFLDGSFESIRDFWYIDPEEYESMFRDTSLEHYHTIGALSVKSKSPIPPASQSIYAGAN